MDCPYCKAPMEKGYIPAGKARLLWLAEDAVPPFFAFSEPEPEDGISLTKTPVLRTQRALAYCCKACRFVLLPLPQDAQ